MPPQCTALDQAGVVDRRGAVPSSRLRAPCARDVAPADVGADWPGGVYSPCHGSKFDFAGRVFKQVPAPFNLEVRHKYMSDRAALIGVA